MFSSKINFQFFRVEETHFYISLFLGVSLGTVTTFHHGENEFLKSFNYFNFILGKYFKTLEILKLATFTTKLKDTCGSLDESERGD